VPAGGAEVVDVDMHGEQLGAVEKVASAAASGRPGAHGAHTPYPNSTLHEMRKA